MPEPHRISLPVIPHLEDACHPAKGAASQVPSAEPYFPGEEEKEKDDTQEGNTAVA